MSDNAASPFDIIKHAVEDNPTEMQDSFADLMLGKIRDIVDSRREQIAASMIGGEKDEEGFTEPGDDDLDLEDLEDDDFEELDDIDLEDNEEGLEADGEDA